MPLPHVAALADRQSRLLDLVLAAVLAAYPLLPSGPQYFGLPSANYPLLGIAMLLALWCVVRIRERRHSGIGPGVRPLWAWGSFLVVATGAALFGMSVENRFSSPVFWAHLGELPGDLLWPMNMLASPMYPVAVWVVFLQGGCAYAVVRDVCLRAPNPRRRAKTAMYGWLAGYACVAGFALFQYLTRFQLHPYWLRVNPDLVRSHSTFEDPNVLAAYLILGLGAIIGFAWSRRRLAQPIGLSVLGLLGGAALYTTVSRSAWAGLPLAVILLAAFAPRTWLAASEPGRRYVRVVARACLVAALIVGSVSVIARMVVPSGTAGFRPESPLQAVLSTLDPRVALTDVFSSRISWWASAVGMFAEHPLTGVGLGRYPRLVQEYARTRVPAENAHNVFLQILAEMGVLGFAGVVLLIGTIFASLGAAGCSRRAEDAAIARGSLLGVTAFLATWLSGHPFLLASGQVVLATMVAAVLVATDGSTIPSDRGTGTRQRDRSPADHEATMTGWKYTATTIAALGLLWFPAAAAGHGPATLTRPAPWGYSWGLFPEENLVGSGVLRWTSERAIIDLEMPPETTTVELRVTAPVPIREGRATEAKFEIGDRVLVKTLAAEVSTVALNVEAEDLTDDGRIQIMIEVDPVLIPSEAGNSDDSRRLGLQLFPPVFGTAVIDVSE